MEVIGALVLAFLVLGVVGLASVADRVSKLEKSVEKLNEQRLIRGMTAKLTAIKPRKRK